MIGAGDGLLTGPGLVQIDGAVPPVLCLNGWQIVNPTVLACITHRKLAALLEG